MNIIIIVGSLGLGGAERVAINLTHWLSAQPEVNVSIVALSRACGNNYTRDNLDCIELDCRLPILALRKILKTRKPDIVLTLCVPLCVFTVPALWGLGIKHIISERNDPAHFAGKTITKIISRTLMRFADGFVFQTKEAQLYYGGKIAKRSVIIHNPLYKSPVMQNERKDSELGINEIVSVGRLNKQKNQALLIEAFADVCKKKDELSLTIYGDGPEKDNLQSLIKKLQMESHIFLPGSTIDIFHKIQNASLFVLCSNFEGMPNALMEAMSLGLPCISTDCPCGGPAELIRQGENGFLIPVGDKASLVGTMCFLLDNRELRNKIGKNAQSICKTHSMEVICNQWYNYLKNVTNS